MNENEIGETDRLKIALCLSGGLPVLRTEYKHNVLTYWFERQPFMDAMRALETPEMEYFKRFIKLYKQVNAEFMAMREANRRNR